MVPAMVKPRLKTAMAAAEMLYSVAHKGAGMPGPQRGLIPCTFRHHWLCLQPGK